MNEYILFEEKQRFRLIWLWIILLSIDAFFLYGVLRQVVNGQQFGSKQISNTELLVAASLMMFLTMLFVFVRLETQIRKDGIYVRFFPFQLRFRKYSWDNIAQSFVRKYNPIVEYGGWGFRLGFSGKGKAYTVSGDTGIQLVFANGSKLLIGTKKESEAKKVLQQIGHLT